MIKKLELKYPFGTQEHVSLHLEIRLATPPFEPDDIAQLCFDMGQLDTPWTELCVIIAARRAALDTPFNAFIESAKPIIAGPGIQGYDELFKSWFEQFKAHLNAGIVI